MRKVHRITNTYSDSKKKKKPGFDPWVRKIPSRRKWQPTPVFLPGEFHRERSLAGHSPWGHRVRQDWVTNTSTFQRRGNSSHQVCDTGAGKVGRELGAKPHGWGRLLLPGHTAQSSQSQGWSPSTPLTGETRHHINLSLPSTEPRVR